MKTTLLTIAALIGLTSVACATNETNVITTASFDPGKFYGLIVNSNVNIVLSQGEHNSIKFEGVKTEINEIKTEIQNGDLVISGGNSNPVTVYISVEEINLIEINGSARVFASGSINSDILLLKVNGNGSMKVDVRTLTVGMIVKGNGKIIVSGSSGESYVRIYGNGNIYTNNLDTFKITEERIAFNETKQSSKRATLKLHQ